MSDEDDIRQLTQQVIADDAFAKAIPHLDLILTPNGFGIVNNNNISPASKDREDRLVARLIDGRDQSLMLLQPRLQSLQTWFGTEQCMFFQATMLPNINITLRFPRGSQPRWEQYLALREAIIPVEDYFANQYLSYEQLKQFRYLIQFRDYHDPLTKRICETLQAIEVRILKSSDPTSAMYFEHTTLCDIVNAIRQNESMYPLWHASDTAKLYNPPIFENKKEATGYWM